MAGPGQEGGGNEKYGRRENKFLKYNHGRCKFFECYNKVVSLIAYAAYFYTAAHAALPAVQHSSRTNARPDKMQPFYERTVLYNAEVGLTCIQILRGIKKQKASVDFYKDYLPVPAQAQAEI